MSMKRFRVAEDSMLPALKPGDEVVAVDSRRPEIGDLVVFAHPGRPDFWLVKRRVAPPSPLRPDEAWVMSDNASATRADSRSFGPVAVDSLMPVVDRLDDESFVNACEMLAAEDEALATVIDTYGPPGFWSRPAGFACLVLLILEQQVSLESGAAAYRRLLDMAGEVTPAAVRRVGSEGIAGAGITRQKTGYVIALADSVMSGDVDLDDLDDMAAEEAKAVLMQMKGIGKWTAETYLVSALRHVDVFPVDDRALQVGTGEVLGMKAPPSPEQLEILSQAWRPVRAAAARLIWHAYLSKRGRTEPGDPLLDARPPEVRRVKSP